MPGQREASLGARGTPPEGLCRSFTRPLLRRVRSQNYRGRHREAARNGSAAPERIMIATSLHIIFVLAKGPNNGYALRDAPFTFPPRSATFHRADAATEGGPTRQACLEFIEGLRQGPPFDLSVSPSADLQRRRRGTPTIFMSLINICQSAYAPMTTSLWLPSSTIRSIPIESFLTFFLPYSRIPHIEIGFYVWRWVFRGNP